MKNLPALVLAAGRGERMRPLTDVTPKPLLKVRGKALLAWHLDALSRAACPRVVVNTAWLGAQISATVGTLWPPTGDDAKAAMPVIYSDEQADFGAALETAGGIARALPHLLGDGEAAFWLVAGDVFVPEFRFAAEHAQAFLAGDDWAHVWLVPNPAHNSLGDFGFEQVNGLGRASEQGERLTYSTLGLYRREFFAAPQCDIPWGNPQGQGAPLAPLLRRAIALGRVGASRYLGPWTDVGTPARLAELNQNPDSD